MRGQVFLSFLLVMLCASNGSTQPEGFHCRQREGASLTMVLDAFLAYGAATYDMKIVLNSLSARFPCVTRQYTSVSVDYAETNVTITNDKSEFLQSITRLEDGEDVSEESFYYYYHILDCKQSLLYGLKRALEISPAESIIWVYTLGSMVDYNNTRLLSEVYTLLEEKKSQVYFRLGINSECTFTASQQDVLEKISSLSNGEFMKNGNVEDYKLTQALELLLSKPLNSSVRILNINLNVTDKYTEAFSVPTSLAYLLLTRNERVVLNIIDPNGNTFAFGKNPRYYYYYNYDYTYNYDILSSHLIKSPAAGCWILNAQGDSSLSVQILGFTGLDKLGNCSDSDCHPNATCLEFGGYGECTCKEGFVGDGTTCNDIDECEGSETDCYSGTCVNTIGSYTCNCSIGFKYTSEFGCVDIDECMDSSLNDCDPVAICTNEIHSYTCTCPYGYFGDGRHCEVNECQQESPCNSNKECMKYIGSYSCIDPCSNHTVLNDPWRSTSNTYNFESYWFTWFHCDNGLYGWYRFKGEYDHQIPEYCVPFYSCGTTNTIWMNGSHPTLSDGTINRTVCSHSEDGCCTQPFNISVKMCPEGFYVYKLQSTSVCKSAYCTESNHNCSGIDCAPDEECGTVDDVHGCHCNDSSNITDGIQPGNLADYLTPQVTCGLENIEVRLSKCLLEKLGYDTSSIHLIDYSCPEIIERSDKVYITLVTQPKYGNCGGDLWNNGTDIIYANTIYLQSKSDGAIKGDEYSINFTCSYPSNLEAILRASPRTSMTSATINVAGTANFAITMGLFQDSGYTTPYTGSEVWLDSSSILYVGVIVTGATGSSQFVLTMQHCYTTPRADSTYSPRYDIIKDRCPNKKDPTISVLENGMSLRGRFSLQVFSFLGGFNHIYLHCQVGLCDTSSNDCSARCPSVRSALGGINNMRSLAVGPIYRRGDEPSGGVPAAPHSGGGIAVPTGKLFISTIVFLLLLY